MYKKLYLLIGASSLLLLSGCINKEKSTKAEPAPIENIEAEKTAQTEPVTETAPNPKTKQTPGLAAHGSVIHLSSSNQLNELTSAGNVVVDFYGPNCGPCRSVSPTIDTLAQQYAGKVVFVKVNVDQFPDISNRFNIRGVPTFYFFKDGTKTDSFSGARNKAFFEQKIKSHFNI